METNLYPPDPLYDSECTPGVLQWRIVESGRVTDNTLASPEFGAKDRLINFADQAFMQRDFEVDLPVKAEVDAFLKAQLGLLPKISELETPELQNVRKAVLESTAYTSAKIVQKAYVDSLISDAHNVRPLEDHSALFFAGFVTQFLLEPINARLKQLEVEARRVEREKRQA